MPESTTRGFPVLGLDLDGAAGADHQSLVRLVTAKGSLDGLGTEVLRLTSSSPANAHADPGAPPFAGKQEGRARTLTIR